ncbi:hypothetical protein EYC84_004026 [Monilinia fructicola]|uniref:D-lactate dehydratase n=1 Tax=Monilinia fructicola TaxID=38448 RepID=A0A5M9K1S0_MONFR|nr:hypothetical protein EYC84_004026 [Monilinia fructicola]
MSSQTQQPKVLFVLTSHDQMGSSGKPTGWYLPELAHPYDILAPHTQITIASVRGAEEFDAIFYVGGHGPMFDLAHNETSHKIISQFHSLNRIVAAVCHGPAALAYAKLPSGKYFLEDTPVTGFSNTEEKSYGVTDVMPFELETALNEASNGKFEKAAEDYAANVVVARGGKVITGQNPASANGVGEAILTQLRKEGKSA